MLDWLTQHGAVDLLILLLKEGKELMVSEAFRKVGRSPEAFYRSIEVLTEKGLIVRRVEKGIPRRVFLALTDKGRKAAELLLELDELVG